MQKYRATKFEGFSPILVEDRPRNPDSLEDLMQAELIITKAMKEISPDSPHGYAGSKLRHALTHIRGRIEEYFRG